MSGVLRFITCGSVDDGKSTLIGRLLWESKQLFDDQMKSLESDSKKFGTQGENIDFALLVDGLSAEREQGITIDVAYRFFSIGSRKCIVADTPGHEQYTRNMATAASTADLAIILIDAQKGVSKQTKRHAYISSMMGIKHICLAINKMDLVSFSKEKFEEICIGFNEFTKDFGFQSTNTIPLSALNGDNIVNRSKNTHWYQGPTLFGFLETIKIQRGEFNKFIFPIQLVNRPNSNFRGFAGTIASGEIKLGEEVRVISSGEKAKVKGIITYDGELKAAQATEAITITLDKEIDASRGDILTHADSPIETSDQFEVKMIWMTQDKGLIGRKYDLKLATQFIQASITSIKYRVNIETLSHDSAKELGLNDILICNISTSAPIAYTRYQDLKTLGSFILIDRFTHQTVAAGMIEHGLRRAQNIHKELHTIKREDREKLSGHAGKVIWFTGLSGSGKSTIANALEVALHKKGLRTYILDGDNIRHGLNKDLGFTDADRVENIRRIAEVAKLMMDAGVIVITAFISPFEQEREMARELIGQNNFFEIYISTSIEECKRRDVKARYKKAQAGLIPNFTGVGSAYEAPIRPDLIIDTSVVAVEESVKRTISALKL